MDRQTQLQLLFIKALKENEGANNIYDYIANYFYELKEDYPEILRDIVIELSATLTQDHDSYTENRQYLRNEVIDNLYNWRDWEEDLKGVNE